MCDLDRRPVWLAAVIAIGLGACTAPAAQHTGAGGVGGSGASGVGGTSGTGARLRAVRAAP